MLNMYTPQTGEAHQLGCMISGGSCKNVMWVKHLLGPILAKLFLWSNVPCTWRRWAGSGNGETEAE
jgi:hypothetical protein